MRCLLIFPPFLDYTVDRNVVPVQILIVNCILSCMLNNTDTRSVIMIWMRILLIGFVGGLVIYVRTFGFEFASSRRTIGFIGRSS